MHIAYLDDSDTKARDHKWQVMTAVIIEDRAFKISEIGMSSIPELLMGADKLEKFQEFHACELYGGHGVFDGIEQSKRHEAIVHLLALLDTMRITVLYGAVDLVALKSEIYGSADPVDMCFRQCLARIKEWADADIDRRVMPSLEGMGNYTDEQVSAVVVPVMLDQLIVLIVDECDNKIKHTLQKSYRSLRPSLVQVHSGPLECFHDDMYFGDSRYSIGIQLADLCSYFIARHIEGDATVKGFYDLIEPRLFPRAQEQGRMTASFAAEVQELTDGSKQ